MSESPTSPPPNEDHNRGVLLVAPLWAISGVATLAVCLRFYGRKLLSNVGADDYVMALTLVLLVLMSSLMTYTVKNGAGRHQYYLTSQQQQLAIKYNWIGQVFVILGLSTGKISVALLIKRLAGPHNTWIKGSLWFIMITLGLFSISDIILTFVQCNPPRALWEQDIPHRCWDSRIQSAFAIFDSCWNITMDFVLAALPISLVWKTALSTRKRITTCALLGLGPVAGACGIIKTQYLVTLNARSDLTWETVPLLVWSGAELFVSMICGSIPPMKPVFDRAFKKSRSRPDLYHDSTSAQRKTLWASYINRRTGNKYDMEGLRSNEDHAGDLPLCPSDRNIYRAMDFSVRTDER